TYMARYQIRTPADVVLGDVIDRLAGTSWRILDKWGFFAGPTTGTDYIRFKDFVLHTLVKHIRTYRLCGLSNICSENIRSTPWASSSHSMDANPWDKIYHLFPKTLEGLLDELTEAAITALRPVLKIEAQSDTESTLRIVFQTILGEYLYE